LKLITPPKKRKRKAESRIENLIGTANSRWVLLRRNLVMYYENNLWHLTMIISC